VLVIATLEGFFFSKNFIRIMILPFLGKKIKRKEKKKL
jgi:hypothetical protein